MEIKFKNRIKELINLSLPILGGNLGQVLINMGDVFVAGHYNTNSLAAISVATAIFMTFIIAAIGLLSAITPVLSNLRGQKQKTRQFLGVTILFSQVLSLIFFIALILIIPLIQNIGLDKAILGDVISYLKISSFSIFAIFLFCALKEFLQAMEIVVFPNILITLSAILNIGLNFLFVYGWKPIPSLGTSGLAFASLCTRVIIALILLFYCFKFLKRNIFKNTKKYIKDIIKTGFPIGGALFIEFLGFNIVAVLLGRFEPLYNACHNIILSVANACFMFPFSISCALSVKVGFANGAKNLKDIKNYILSALCLTFLYAIFAVTIYLTLKEPILRTFTDDFAVIETGKKIMVIAACFATFDGIQTVCTGALKGLKQTRQILVIMCLSYLLISIPLGLILAYKFHIILEGFWLGLAFGLFSASIVSGCVLIKKYFQIKNSNQQIYIQ